jgi:methyl-accepting chemotaxis protein
MTIKRTIALSLTIVVLVIFTVGQGSVWLWFLFSQKSHNQSLLLNKMETAANIVAQTYRQVIVSGGTEEELQQYLGSMSVVEDVLSVRVRDNENMVIAERNIRKEPESGWLKNPLFIPRVNTVAVPVNIGASTKEGAVEVVYSGARVNSYMFDLMTIPTVIEGVVIFLVIVGIFLHLYKSVGKPLGVIQERIDRATAGDLTVKIPEYGDNEIGVISKGLKFLVEALQLNISNINGTTKSVAAAAGNLNTGFDEVGDDIKRQSTSTDGIVNSLKQASEAFRDITDSTEKLSEFSSDNVSFLLEVKSTSDEIVSNTNKMFRAVEDSYSVVAEMSQTSKVVASSSQDVLSSVDETLASIEEIRASIKEVEKNAKESSTLAAKVREMAVAEGTLVVADAIEGMENISSTVNNAVEMVESLGTRSADIQKMLQVIREVTEQTNLLSLNAAILAEQAGEFGKGFAVVADEMRALSDRTATSTKEIAGVTNTIQEEIAGVMFSIKEGMEMVNAGEALVYKVGESMGAILEAAQKSSVMAETIDHATGEQASSLDLVTQAMGNIKTMADKMSAVMLEQQKGSEHLLERVGEVKEVAEITKRSTEEQASGTAMMSKNVELASTKISGINAAVFEQQTVHDSIVTASEEIRKLGGTSLKHMEEMKVSLSRLSDEIVALRSKMTSFKVE